MCTELFGEIDYTGRFVLDPSFDQYDYFQSLDTAVFTLFVMVTLDWSKVARATMQVYPWSAIIFSTFVTFSSFCLYNLVVAVVCDAVKMVQDQDDVLMVEKYYKDKLEAKERVVNLRQKMDKMTRQQNDLLVTVKLMLQQLDLVDEASRVDYEETLVWLGKVNADAKDALEFAVKNLDNLDASGSGSHTRVADAWEREIQERFEVIHGEEYFEIEKVPSTDSGQDAPMQSSRSPPPLAVKSIGLGTFEIVENGSKFFDDVRLDDDEDDDDA